MTAAAALACAVGAAGCSAAFGLSVEANAGREPDHLAVVAGQRADVAPQPRVPQPRLVRAGQARLRERFRDRMPAMFGG